MRIKVWTEAYNAFRMGGSCNYPLATEMDLGNWFHVGNGFMCTEVRSPDGKKKIVVEMRSGAIVGNNAEQVMEDIAACPDIAVMEKQVEDAIKRVKSASTAVVSNDEFWQRYKGESA